MTVTLTATTGLDDAMRLLTALANRGVRVAVDGNGRLLTSGTTPSRQESAALRRLAGDVRALLTSVNVQHVVGGK